MVAQPRPRLRQPASPVGTRRRLDRHVDDPHGCRRHAGDPAGLGLYAFNLFALGPILVLFFVNLMMMGWWVALGVVSLILRHGAGAEALAWSVLFGLTPFSAVFYPVAVLPAALRPIALALPSAHVFEGMRAVLLQRRDPLGPHGLGGRAEHRLDPRRRAGLRPSVPRRPGARRPAEHRRMTEPARLWLIRHALVDENARAILYGTMDVELCPPRCSSRRRCIARWPTGCRGRRLGGDAAVPHAPHRRGDFCRRLPAPATGASSPA